VSAVSAMITMNDDDRLDRTIEGGGGRGLPSGGLLGLSI